MVMNIQNIIYNTMKMKPINRLLTVILLCIMVPSMAQNASDTFNRNDKYGKKYGYWKQYKDGKLAWEGNFFNGEPVGSIIHYYTNGNIESIAKYYPSSPRVDAVIYHSNGQKAAQGEYIDKKKNGKWQYFSNKGILISEENWNKGLKNGLSTLYSSTDGTLLEEINWKMGKMHGIYKTYYTTGQNRISMNYENGKMHGSFVCYYPDGKIWNQGQYTNNIKSGTWTRYNEDGNILKIETLEKGFPVRTILGFATPAQWLQIDASQIAYLYYQGDDIYLRLNNNKTIKIINTTLNDIASNASVEILIFINDNVLSSYNAIRKVVYSKDEDGNPEAVVTLRPTPPFEVIASGNYYESLKSLLNTNEPSDND